MHGNTLRRRPLFGYLCLQDRLGLSRPRSLRSDSDIKIVATMNFYTQSWPELSRPRDLNRHLFGDE
jgi:hypothetical protein